MTQPQDKMRAEFEAWCVTLHNAAINDQAWDEAEIRDAFFNMKEGFYQNSSVQYRWETWQAACAQQSAQSQQDAQGDKPLLVRLAEDFAEDCILAGYVTTGAESHTKLMAAAQQDALDAARIDWLESSKESHGFCHSAYGEYRHYAHQQKGYKTVRETIDFAIAAQGASNV